MTTRHAGYIVTLRADIREDDAEQLVAAIKLLSPVASVTPVESNIDLALARERAKHELTRKLWEALK
jgi:hypothetical protein